MLAGMTREELDSVGGVEETARPGLDRRPARRVHDAGAEGFMQAMEWISGQPRQRD